MWCVFSLQTDGSKTVFVYSNLVKVGIEIFQEILLQNGYLEFNENQSYLISDNTIDYFTGLTNKEFKKVSRWCSHLYAEADYL